PRRLSELSLEAGGWTSRFFVQPSAFSYLYQVKKMATPDIHAHRILILDFGSQYSQLIARRVREIGVFCELHPFDMSDEAIRAFNPRGIILAGGPESVHASDSPRAPQAVFDLGVPLFGICYGMQTMSEQLGGKVEGSDLREFGYARVD